MSLHDHVHQTIPNTSRSSAIEALVGGRVWPLSLPANRGTALSFAAPRRCRSRRSSNGLCKQCFGTEEQEAPLRNRIQKKWMPFDREKSPPAWFPLRDKRWSDPCIPYRKGRGLQSISPNSASGLRSVPPWRSWLTSFSATWKTSNNGGQSRFNDLQRGSEDFTCWPNRPPWGGGPLLDNLWAACNESLRTPILGRGARNLCVVGNCRCGHQSQPAFPPRRHRILMYDVGTGYQSLSTRAASPSIRPRSSGARCGGRQRRNRSRRHRLGQQPRHDDGRGRRQRS